MFDSVGCIDAMAASVRAESAAIAAQRTKENEQ